MNSVWICKLTKIRTIMDVVAIKHCCFALIEYEKVINRFLGAIVCAFVPLCAAI